VDVPLGAACAPSCTGQASGSLTILSWLWDRVLNLSHSRRGTLLSVASVSLFLVSHAPKGNESNVRREEALLVMGETQLAFELIRTGNYIAAAAPT
jgi:hypothetical protein